MMKAKAKAGLFKDEATRTKMLEFIGYLEEKRTVTPEQIRDMTDRLWNMRESLVSDNGVPVDGIFQYALNEAIKYKADSIAYIGKVIREAVMKWRDGVLKV